MEGGEATALGTCSSVLTDGWLGYTAENPPLTGGSVTAEAVGPVTVVGAAPVGTAYNLPSLGLEQRIEEEAFTFIIVVRQAALDTLRHSYPTAILPLIYSILVASPTSSGRSLDAFGSGENEFSLLHLLSPLSRHINQALSPEAKWWAVQKMPVVPWNSHSRPVFRIW